MPDLDTYEGRAAYIADCERKIAEDMRQQAYMELEHATRILTAQMEFQWRIEREIGWSAVQVARKQERDRAGKDTDFIFA